MKVKVRVLPLPKIKIETRKIYLPKNRTINLEQLQLFRTEMWFSNYSPVMSYYNSYIGSSSIEWDVIVYTDERVPRERYDLITNKMYRRVGVPDKRPEYVY